MRQFECSTKYRRARLLAPGAAFHLLREKLLVLLLAFSILPAFTGKAQAQSTPAATKISILGTGNGALLKSPLTDPENDGVDAAGMASDPAGNWNWVSADASIEPDFEGGENAFNVFDHKVDAGGNDKWCCDDPTPDAPVWVAVQFANPVSLTHFTVTSGNDSPDRDPTDWAIQGSNDGATYTDIYHFKGTTVPWNARLQVVLFELPAPAAAYTYIRYIAYETPGTLHQISEIEYYGLQAGAKFTLSAPEVSFKGLTFVATSTSVSTVDTNSVKLTIDNQPVTATVTALGPTVTIAYNASPILELASQHTYSIEVKDAAGQTVTSSGTVTIPSGYFPLTNIPGPTPVGTNWAVRFIYGSLSTNVDGLAAAMYLVTNVGSATFDAVTNDVSVKEINYNGGGIFINDNPYPAAVTNDAAFTGDNFVVEGIYQLNITEEGDYTFGFHSDDGFGFRIRGARVQQVGGSGMADPNDPEAVVFPGGTGDANTRAVYHLTNGTYRVEYVGFESGGGDNFEVYWSKGAFTGDRIVGPDWRLLGSGTAVTPLFPLASNLPSPAVTNGAWAIRWIFGASDENGPIQITSLQMALRMITNAGNANFTETVVDTTSPVINYVNSGIAGGGTGGLIGNNLPLPDEIMNDAAWTGEDYVMLAVGNINVPEEGDYTFGYHSDDGAALRIVGGDVVAIYGGSGLDLGNTGAVVFPGTTGDSDTRAVYHLKKGIYRVEFIYFERGGGDAGELYVAKGAFAADADTTTWMLAGDPAGGQTYNVLGLSAPVTVVSSDPSTDTVLATTADALAALAATGGASSNYSTVNIGDPDTNAGVLAFPKDHPGVDDNNYALRITGSIVVTNAGTYVLGFNSDDGGYLKLNGQTFIDVLPGSASPGAILQAADQIVCDCLTGDANSFATVTLAAGTYPFEAVLFEQGGGSYITVKGVENGADRRFVPALSTNSLGAVTMPTSLGPLTSQSPGQEESAKLSVTRDGNSLTISWTGTGYQLQSADAVVGPYTTVAGVTGTSATIPIDTAAHAKFYRLIKP